MNTNERIKKVISNIVNLPEIQISDTDTLLDLGITSLNILELAYDIGDEFVDVRFYNQLKEIDENITVEQITTKVELLKEI